MADQGPGPSLTDIAAARRHLHERQADMLAKMIPGAGGHTSQPDVGTTGDTPVGQGLKEAEDVASGIKTKMAHESGVHVPPQRPLPEGTNVNSNQGAGAGSTAATDPLSNVRAHSPVELPSTPAELPASPARDAADAAPPSSLQYPQAMSPPRVPSGVLLCNRGPAGRPAEPHAGSAAPLVATTSVPGSPPCVPATSAGMVDNALQMALAGSAGMEGPMEHGSPASASLRDHHHAFERGAGPAAQHAPTTTTPSSHSHSGGAAGGGLLSRVMAPFVAHAEVGEGVSEEASEPQYADRQQPNPYDSNQAMNMGPEGDSRADNRAYVGGVPMALGSLADRVTNTLHDMVEAGARALGDNSGGPPPAVQPEDLPGMPGSMEIDEEIRAMRAEQAAQQAAARSAAREEAEAAEPAAGEGREGEGAAALHEAAEVHHAEDARTAEPTVGGGSGGGGVLGKLVGKVANVLHLHAPDSPEQQHADTSSSEGAPQQPQEFGERVGQQSAEERRADAPVPLKAPGGDVAAAAGRVPAHPGTSEVEQGPSGSPEEVAQARRELGIPAGAQHAAEARDDLNTKEGGQPGPAGALGQPRPNPDAHVQAYAPDAAQPNFFSEVERRGLGDVLKHGAANVKDRVQEMSDRSGGEPAAWAVTSGAVSDTRDITRNVERVDHMDDPTQRKIYDGETYKVGAQHPKVTADKRSEAEAAKEDTSAMVLGQNKPISGAVPHEKPDLPIGASGTGTGEGPKTAAAKGPFDGIGTAKGCAPDERDASVREATAPFLAYSEPSQGPAHGGSSVWSLAASAASAVASRIFPVAKAVGAGSAGTPTGTDRTQRPPTTDFGDNTAGRPDAAYGPPPGRSQDMPTPGGITNAPKAHVHRAHNKNEPPEGRDLVPEHTLMENIQSKLAGSPEAAGVPRRGVDEPGQRSDLLIPPLEEKAHRIHDGLPDKMARIGESVGGALQHVLDATSEAVKAVPNSMAGNVHPRESEQKRMAKEAPGGEEAGAVDPYTHPGGVVPAGLGEHGAGTARQMDLRSGGIMSAHHAARIEGALQDPEPARKRDTFMDKVLYPFSKDAGKPDAAIAQARSYYEYVEEKQKKQEVADKAAAEEEANRPLSDKAKDVASTAIEKAEEKMEKLHLGRLLPPGERARLEGHSSEGGSFGHKESPAPAKPPALGPEGKDGRLHLEQSDKPFSERDFNLDAPGARGPRVNEEGKAWTQSGSGTRHVTGDVVTEVPAALGQAVMDTGRSLMHKLGAGEQRAEDRASEAAQDVRGRSERAAEDVRASAERTAADVRDSAHRTAEDVRGAAERGGYEAKQAAHEAKAGGINLLDRAALAVGNVIETLVGGGSHTVPVPPAVAPASTSPTTASDLPRGVKEADVTYDTRPPHTERADDSGTYVHAPGTGTTGSADGGASLGVGGMKEEPQAGAGGEEGGLASRVLGKLGSMLGGGGEHGHGAKEQQGAAQEARDRLASAMAPAGEHDLAGYGRGASEHGLHIKEGEDRHVIPVMPYISTEELMKQRATQQQE